MSLNEYFNFLIIKDLRIAVLLIQQCFNAVPVAVVVVQH